MPSSVLARICADCERPARRRGTRCDRCHKKAWRAANLAYAQAREAERLFSPSAKALRSARAAVAVAVKRGKVAREACRDCGRTAHPHHPDPARPLEFVWLCRAHRTVEREREVIANRAAAERQQHMRWTNDRERFAVEFPSLPADLQAQLQTKAKDAIAADPRLCALALSSSAPLARQMLVRIYMEWVEEQARES